MMEVMEMMMEMMLEMMMMMVFGDNDNDDVNRVTC